jgi:hypothetical protein
MSKTKADAAEISFLTFAREVLAQLRQWAKSSVVPEYHDVKTVFEDGCTRETVSVRPNYWSLLRQHDRDLKWISSAATPCIKVHLEQGILKVPSPSGAEGEPVLEPSFEEVCNQLATSLLSPIIDAIESRDSLRVDALVLSTFYRSHRTL